MIRRALMSEVFGGLLIAAAFAWAAYDASQHAGRVAGLTVAGALLLAASGGWLISKTKTLALLDFLFEQAKRAVSIKIPPAGSDDVK